MSKKNSPNLVGKSNVAVDEPLKILVICSRKNLANARKFEIIFNQALAENKNLVSKSVDLVTNIRPEIPGETFSFARVGDNRMQIEKLQDSVEQHEVYLNKLKEYDVAVIYLPTDMRSMYEIGILESSGIPIILFFSDEVVRYNVMFLPGSIVYGYNNEIDDLKTMLDDLYQSSVSPGIDVVDDSKE
jgi:hypothetical protein